MHADCSTVVIYRHDAQFFSSKPTHVALGWSNETLSVKLVACTKTVLCSEHCKNAKTYYPSTGLTRRGTGHAHSLAVRTEIPRILRSVLSDAYYGKKRYEERKTVKTAPL